MLGVAAEAVAVAAVAEDIPEAVAAEEEAVVSPVAGLPVVVASVVAVNLEVAEVVFPAAEIPERVDFPVEREEEADFPKVAAKGLPAEKVTEAAGSLKPKAGRGICRIVKIPIRKIVKISRKTSSRIANSTANSSNRIARTMPPITMITIITEDTTEARRMEARLWPARQLRRSSVRF